MLTDIRHSIEQRLAELDDERERLIATLAVLTDQPQVKAQRKVTRVKHTGRKGSKHDKIVQLLAEGVPAKTIAKRLKVTTSYVYMTKSKMNGKVRAEVKADKPKTKRTAKVTK